MQVMNGLFDDLRVLEKEQQLELQELENELMELENDASSAVTALTCALEAFLGCGKVWKKNTSQGSTFFPRGWAYFPSKTQNTRGVGGWRAGPKTQNTGGRGAVLQLGPPARLGLGLE